MKKTHSATYWQLKLWLAEKAHHSPAWGILSFPFYLRKKFLRLRGIFREDRRLGSRRT